MQEHTSLRTAPEDRPIAGCTATSLLKLIALVFMFTDHAGKMLFGNAMDLRLLGRIAFPIYGWCLVCGAQYTRSMPKYLLRLLLLYAISQPINMVALNHDWSEPNIFLTLAVSLIGLWGMREKKLGSQFWAPVLALILAVLLECDYNWRGVLFILLLWQVRGTRGGIAALVLAYCLFWGGSTGQLRVIFGIDMNLFSDTVLWPILQSMLHTQFMAIFALPFLLMRLPSSLQQLRLPKALGYAIYPAHLAVLAVLECIMLPNGSAAVYHRLMGLVVQPVLQLFGL